MAQAKKVHVNTRLSRQRFPTGEITRESIAEDLNNALASLLGEVPEQDRFKADDRRLTTKVCADYALSVGGIQREDWDEEGKRHASIELAQQTAGELVKSAEYALGERDEIGSVSPS